MRRCDVQLPGHHKATSNRRRGVLSAKDRSSRGFRAHANTEEQTNDKKLLPGLSEGGTERSQETEDCGDEDSSSTTKVVIDRVGKPAATIHMVRKSWRGWGESSWYSSEGTYSRAEEIYGPLFQVLVLNIEVHSFFKEGGQRTRSQHQQSTGWSMHWEPVVHQEYRKRLGTTDWHHWNRSDPIP